MKTSQQLRMGTIECMHPRKFTVNGCCGLCKNRFCKMALEKLVKKIPETEKRMIHIWKEKTELNEDFKRVATERLKAYTDGKLVRTQTQATFREKERNNPFKFAKELKAQRKIRANMS